MQWLGFITPAREHSLAMKRITTMKLLNINSVLQSTSIRLVVVVIPESAVAEDEEPLSECAMNKVTTILHIFRTSFNHCEMVHRLLYTYKFLREVNFADFVVSWPSANF